MERVGAGNKHVASVNPWSVDEKLALLSCYIGTQHGQGGFLKATRQAPARYYIDLFAGPGQNQVKGTDQIVDGSPLIALKAGPPRFSHLYWVEAKRRSAASLEAHQREYPDRGITILLGNANERVDDVLRTLPRKAPTFAFLDPYASELDWQTVVKLARHKAHGFPKIELFILFAVDTAYLRLMPRASWKMRYQAVLDRVMPDPEGWRRLYDRRAAGGYKPQEIRRAMLDEYVAGLRSLGYKWVPAPRLIFRSDGHPLYFLIFASDHKAGNDIMEWCLKHVQQSRRQPSLLNYADQY